MKVIHLIIRNCAEFVVVYMHLVSLIRCAKLVSSMARLVTLDFHLIHPLLEVWSQSLGLEVLILKGGLQGTKAYSSGAGSNLINPALALLKEGILPNPRPIVSP